MRAWFSKLSSDLLDFLRWCAALVARALGRLAALVRRAFGSRLVTVPARIAARALGSGLRTASTAALLAALALTLVWGGFERVPVATIGVQQAVFGGGGLVERDFAPGLWRSTRGL